MGLAFPFQPWGASRGKIGIERGSKLYTNAQWKVAEPDHSIVTEVPQARTAPVPLDAPVAHLTRKVPVAFAP